MLDNGPHLSPWDVLSLGRFVSGTFCPCDALSIGTFCPWGCFVLGTFSPLDVLSVGHFVPGTFCPWDVLYVHQLSYVISSACNDENLCILYCSILSYILSLKEELLWLTYRPNQANQ